MFIQLAIINFVSAVLTFSIQPMISKMALPHFGGSSMVWNTALMFFQGVLFLGYLYVYYISKHLTPRKQVVVHLLLILLAFLSLPLAINTSSDSISTYPAFALISILIVSIGLPYFVVCTTSPLTQRWYASATSNSSKSPYILYSVSNAGSLLALLLYPVFVEPTMSNDWQRYSWSLGFVVFAIVLIILLTRDTKNTGNIEIETKQATTNNAQKFKWFLYAFVPSLYLMGTTLHISIDIAATPFLWVIPLSLYLISFIVAFSRPELALRSEVVLIQAILIILLSLYFHYDDMLFLLGLHLLGLLLVGLVCHSRLAMIRPDKHHLAEFYVWVALGGWCGGIASTIIAPAIFNTNIEYPIAILLASLLRPSDSNRFFTKSDITLPILLIGFVVLLSYVPLGSAQNYIVYGVVIAGIYGFRNRPVKFTLVIAALISWNLFLDTDLVKYRERTFYGIYDVNDNPEHKVRYLTHGTTIHGAQAINNPRLQTLPLGYYNPEGPLGQVVKNKVQHGELKNIGVVGLGVGTIACYGSPDIAVKFYEIDPAMVNLARKHFTYLEKCSDNLSIQVTDGRLGLDREKDGLYDVLVMDAFSSDSIPTHLLSLEAISMYSEKLTSTGTLLFHTSNRYVDLLPVLAKIAEKIGFKAYVQSYQPNARELDRGALASDWVMFTRKSLTTDKEPSSWNELGSKPEYPLWTDRYSNLFEAVAWDRVLWH